MWQKLFREYSTYWQVKAVRTVFWVRFLAYFLIYVSPVWGMVLAIFLDSWDWDYLEKYNVSKEWYHRIDKVVDYIQYIVMIPLVIGTPISTLYLLFLAWRTIGTIGYFALGMKTKLFVLFPNVAEYLVLAYFVSEAFNFGWAVTSTPWIIGILVFKVLMELQLHYFQFYLPIAGATNQPWLMRMHSKFNKWIIK